MFIELVYLEKTFCEGETHNFHSRAAIKVNLDTKDIVIQRMVWLPF